MTRLSDLPTERIRAALDHPSNAASQETLQRALSLRGGKESHKGENVAQRGTQALRQPQKRDRDAVMVVLSLPPKDCSPNARIHWRRKASAVQGYRRVAQVMARAALAGRTGQQWSSASALCTFYLPDRRRRDADNLLSACKAAFDGIVDAGVLADDSGLTHLPAVLLVDRDNPRVEIEIRSMRADFGPAQERDQ